jgi:hypothetical protein
MKSVIKWHTGIPKEVKRYIVTIDDGRVTSSFWGGISWSDWNKSIIAWCSLNDIEPYKE